MQRERRFYMSSSSSSYLGFILFVGLLFIGGIMQFQVKGNDGDEGSLL
jgi:hypothetical protein